MILLKTISVVFMELAHPIKIMHLARGILYPSKKGLRIIMIRSPMLYSGFPASSKALFFKRNTLCTM